MPAKKKITVKKKAAVKKKTTAKRKKSGNKGKFIVVVESPAKSKTINKILGKNYKVLASMGHVIDLPARKMGIDFSNKFKPEYVVMKGRTKYLKDIVKEAKNAESVFLAADPDREGEAISWHIMNHLHKLSATVFRVRFGEITEKAVKEAFENKGEVDMNKVNAQQARRVMDRIVGYSLSPLLWKMITRGLSAGRVQSVAVRLIVEREEAIKKFVPVEYWSLDVTLKKNDVSDLPKDVPAEFTAKLVKHNGEKVHINNKEEAEAMQARIEAEKFIVGDIVTKDKKSYPRAPYTTSVMQQDAFNKLNYSASKTMRTAQRLYEGIELGSEGSKGLITYMRTDSVRISDDAFMGLKEYIKGNYGDNYWPEKPHIYKSKKRAQEGHEAIRPTLPLKSPEEVEQFLNPNEYKLYALIWNRFIASQMVSAVYSVLTVHIKAGDFDFRAGGTKLIFDGFLRVYKENDTGGETLTLMPPLEKGEEVDFMNFLADQHFTKSPPRYSDASLVKELEEKGIGRPSTYAPIIRTIIDRNYVRRLQRYFQPTELGGMVNEFLVENFPNVFDYEFTARMENELDDVEDGKSCWSDVVNDFYAPFSGKLEEAQDRLKNYKKKDIITADICAECGKPMVIKWGRRGKFLSCSDFPACRFSKSITTGVKCPDETCEGELVERKSSRGAFYGCTGYPKCTYTSRTLPKRVDEEGPEEASTVED